MQIMKYKKMIDYAGYLSQKGKEKQVYSNYLIFNLHFSIFNSI